RQDGLGRRDRVSQARTGDRRRRGARDADRGALVAGRARFRRGRVKRRQASPRAAKRAREVVTELGIRDPEELTVELIAAHYGAMTFYRPLRNEEGRLLRKGGRGIIVVADGLAGTPRARFVAAHELGHFLLHEGIDQYSLCQTADLTEYRSHGIEAGANQFAAELLMPEPFFAPLCDRNRPCLDDLVELSKRFATSLMATAFR